METARLDMAVLLFRDFNENFSIVDDLDLAPALPPLPDVETMAGRENPILGAAIQTLRVRQPGRHSGAPGFSANHRRGCHLRN